MTPKTLQIARLFAENKVADTFFASDLYNLLPDLDVRQISGGIYQLRLHCVIEPAPEQNDKKFQTYVVNRESLDRYMSSLTPGGRNKRVVTAATCVLQRKGTSKNSVRRREKIAEQNAPDLVGLRINEFALGSNFSLAHMPTKGRKYCADMRE